MRLFAGGVPEGVRQAVQRTEDGYAVEVAVPGRRARRTARRALGRVASQRDPERFRRGRAGPRRLCPGGRAASKPARSRALEPSYGASRRRDESAPLLAALRAHRRRRCSWRRWRSSSCTASCSRSRSSRSAPSSASPTRQMGSARHGFRGRLRRQRAGARPPRGRQRPPHALRDLHRGVEHRHGARRRRARASPRSSRRASWSAWARPAPERRTGRSSRTSCRSSGAPRRWASSRSAPPSASSSASCSAASASRAVGWRATFAVGGAFGARLRCAVPLRRGQEPPRGWSEGRTHEAGERPGLGGGARARSPGSAPFGT